MVRHAIRLFLVTFFPVLAGCDSLGQVPGGLVADQSLTAPDGLTRWFHYYVREEGLAANAPVMIVLHGGTGNFNWVLRNRNATNEWLEVAREEGFLLLVPNGVDPRNGNTRGRRQQWNDCRSDAPALETGADDVGFVSALIDWADENFDVDLDRVYVTGASNGGMMSYRLAIELGDRLAGIAAFIANLPADSECGAPAGPVPVFIANGTEDGFIPWEGGAVTADPSRGRVQSASSTRDFWLSLNNAGGASSTENGLCDAVCDDSDGSTVSRAAYGGSGASAPVVFYTVEGGGHIPPSIDHVVRGLARRVIGLGNQNRDIEGVRRAWEFLKRQSL